MQNNYAHRKSVALVRPQVSWNVCRKPTKMPTSLGVSLYCCCLTAWAVGHRSGGSFVFILSPNGSFPPVVYLPVSQIISVILSFAPVSGGPCHFKKKSLSFLWQTCGWFHRDTVLLSYQNYGRRRTSIFLYKALEDDLVTLRHLNK